LKNTTENKGKRKPERTPVGESAFKNERKSEGGVESKSQRKTEVKSERKLSGKPERKTEFKSNRKSEFKPERKSEFKSNRKSEFKPERKSEFKPEVRDEINSVNEGIIMGRNAVIEALKADREIEKILVSGTGEGSIKKIIAMASDKKIPIHFSDKVTLDRAANGENHQGVVASVSAAPNVEIEEILAYATSRGEDPFIIILDGIEDPHNLGAIIRTAECAGAHGVIIPKRRAAGITEIVSKTSAGAIEYMRCARVANIAQTIEKLKAQGVWIAACDMYGSTLFESELKGPIGIVIGGEGNGIGKLVKEKCDFAISIPMKGHISSLNASNAAAVVLYEVRRQRDGK
jgi:23S rRNA (guanosine2251-2'-O)-methyltransferase